MEEKPATVREKERGKFALFSDKILSLSFALALFFQVILFDCKQQTHVQRAFARSSLAKDDPFCECVMKFVRL